MLDIFPNRNGLIWHGLTSSIRFTQCPMHRIVWLRVWSSCSEPSVGNTTVRRVGGAPRIGAKAMCPATVRTIVGEVRNVRDRMHHHMTVGDQLQKLLEFDGDLTLNEGEHIPQKSAVGSKRTFRSASLALLDISDGDHDDYECELPATNQARLWACRIGRI